LVDCTVPAGGSTPGGSSGGFFPAERHDPDMSGVEPLYVGVDWTAGSWFAVAFDRSRFDHAGVFEGIGDLWARYEERAERILVDVPIGLVEDGEAERVCDRLAREILGPRRGTVFTPPVRAATRKRRYPAAKRVNERKSGQPLSEQAFAVSDAIAQVDELLGNVPEAGPVFAESHPEVCFRAFAGTAHRSDPVHPAQDVPPRVVPKLSA